ncbi:MAG: phosphatidate cytidylyltransferase [Holosporales bacterium]|nr:phosphatidate cytidylyltransferase [Holosporales bacterium]
MTHRVVSACILIVLCLLILRGPPLLFSILSLCVLARSAYEIFSLPSARSGRTGWLCAAFFLMVCGGILCLMILRVREGERSLLAWLIAVVCTGDISAYGIGSWIGGPKIFPHTSPHKTWSGSLGGVACATVVGGFWCPIADQVNPFILSIGVALAGVLGDYVESFVKRRLAVKDFGFLIPGHGGVLDRIDSLLLAALFLCGILCRM